MTLYHGNDQIIKTPNFLLKVILVQSRRVKLQEESLSVFMDYENKNYF